MKSIIVMIILIGAVALTGYAELDEGRIETFTNYLENYKNVALVQVQEERFQLVDSPKPIRIEQKVFVEESVKGKLKKGSTLQLYTQIEPIQKKLFTQIGQKMYLFLNELNDPIYLHAGDMWLHHPELERIIREYREAKK